MKAMLMRYILGFPKSIWLNFRKLPFRQAIRMPILVYRTKLKSISGSIEIKAAKLKTGLIKIGFGTTQVSDIQRERVILNIDGRWFSMANASSAQAAGYSWARTPR